MPTKEEMEAARTPAGGFTKETLAGWGVAWPPPKGWAKRLLAGQPALAVACCDCPSPKSLNFDSHKHGLLAPPKVTYRKLY